MRPKTPGRPSPKTQLRSRPGNPVKTKSQEDDNQRSFKRSNRIQGDEDDDEHRATRKHSLSSRTQGPGKKERRTVNLKAPAHESVESESTGSESAGNESAGSESAGSESVGSDSPTVDSVSDNDDSPPSLDSERLESADGSETGSDAECLDNGDEEQDEQGNEQEDEQDDEQEAPGEVESDFEFVDSAAEEDEANLGEEALAASLPHDREALRLMIERLVDSTRKGADVRLRGGRPRSELVARLVHAVAKYFGYNLSLARYFVDLFGPVEALEFFEANERPRTVTLRTNTLKTRRRELAQVLIARGCNVDVLGEWSKHGLVVTDSTVPVGATPEYLAGHYMLQAASSFLPVIALQPRPDEYVLDMAAAPGGKTSFIAQLMRNSGVIVSNDASKTRGFALAANVHRLGITNCVVVNFDGRKLSENLKRPFDRVLLDAPCSGSGVFSKDPEAKIKRTPEDFKKLAALQKELLCQAVDLTNAKSTVNGAGVIVYSTCSCSVEENEQVIDYILKNRRVKLVDTGISFGTPGLTRYHDKRFDESLALTRRFYPHKNNMDGFFVAKLVKLDAPPIARAKRDRSKKNEYVKDAL